MTHTVPLLKIEIPQRAIFTCHAFSVLFVYMALTARPSTLERPFRLGAVTEEPPILLFQIPRMGVEQYSRHVIRCSGFAAQGDCATIIPVDTKKEGTVFPTSAIVVRSAEGATFTTIGIPFLVGTYPFAFPKPCTAGASSRAESSSTLVALQYRVVLLAVPHPWFVDGYSGCMPRLAL